MRPHISIVVKDAVKSVEFYKKVFGVPPQKQTSNYAKFDLKEPALNFSLQSGEEASRVSHFGIEVDSPEQVLEWGKRLKEQGLLKYTEENSSCCFARQDKAWFSDPDGNSWEVFYVHEQLPVVERAGQGACCA